MLQVPSNVEFTLHAIQPAIRLWYTVRIDQGRPGDVIRLVKATDVYCAQGRQQNDRG